MKTWCLCWLLASGGAAFLLACGGTPTEEAVRGAGYVAAPPGAEMALADDLEAAEAAAAVGEVAAERPAERQMTLGPGFVVWESNRDGHWRIWTRQLAGGPARRLSPAAPGRDHCCPHISPDGRQVAYLSGEGGGDEYPPGGMVGALHLIAPDGSADRVVAPVARSYFENRAVVWRSEDELVHIDGERATVALELSSGRHRRLADPPSELAWLIDATLSWATTGRPEFAPYDAGRRAVVPRRRLGGCQPYFSRDGRWGFWTAGAGGPIDRIELAGGRVGRILEKNDPRVPDGFGYAYFPMLSADGRLFAWAASRGGHDHFSTDYEVFVAESDPDTLELLGPALRITRDPGTDRFPDLWQPPLALGRQAGEAPLTVRLAAPSAGDWRWSFGDEVVAEGATVEHTWDAPGRYEVVARLGEQVLRGLTVVRPAWPPRALTATALAGGLELVVGFDEPVDVGGVRLELTSRGEIADATIGPGDHSLTVRLAEPLRSADLLTVSGVRDRAQQANTMAPTTLVLEPPAWPASREGLVFLWETGEAANLVPDPELGADRSFTLAARGEARLDADFGMVVDRGSFALKPEEAARLRAAVQATNQLSLEATVEPGGADGRIVTWAGEKALNMWLEQRSGRLTFGLRTGSRGPQAYPRLDLFGLPSDLPAHLLVTYEPGRLTAYLNGELRLDSSAAQGGLYHWRDLPLSFGDGSWSGRIEGVALYDRVLEPAEVGEAHRLYLEKRGARLPIPRSVVEVTLLARSKRPTLAEISPYREALFTVAYKVERRISGPPVTADLRVAQWAVLDGTALAVTRASAGDRLRLTLEPFHRQPQLESVYLADTLGGESADTLGGESADTLGGEPGELFYVVDATAAR